MVKMTIKAWRAANTNNTANNVKAAPNNTGSSMIRAAVSDPPVAPNASAAPAAVAPAAAPPDNTSVATLSQLQISPVFWAWPVFMAVLRI